MQKKDIGPMEAGYIVVDGMKIRVDKVIAVYEVWTMGKLPFPIVTFKVVARAVGDYQAVPNVAVRSPVTGQCEYTSGLGQSIDDVLKDAIQRFWEEVAKASVDRELEEADFVWT